ncbi:MAG TPA: 4-hydroxy-tetrahydrodipicolinate synthase [Candidatus Acidoferrales bacterium]|nr:4-hydroxy-tetrahydrodipicolinate synthase [Candidatus Acidoferrales bacterium]
MIFEGVYPALITPFMKDKKLDIEGLKSNIEHLMAGGVAGFVPCGSTGESATLSFNEHKATVDAAVDVSNVPIIAGTGSNNTTEAIDLTKHAQDAGADAALLIVPYYNKPMKNGLIEHFSAIADATEFPLILYNIPGRTGINMDPETISVLAHEYSNIMGVKEASANFSQISDVLELTQGLEFYVLAGDDSLTLPMMSLGATGVISVAANILPKKMTKLVRLCLDGNYTEARKLHFELSPLFGALFIETNPIPIKKACGLMGLAGGPMRLPLTDMQDSNVAKLKSVLSMYADA